MTTIDLVRATLGAWRSVVGEDPVVGAEHTGRALWPVTASDGRDYFLKRLGPWRNLPVADEARVLRWLAQQGIEVAEFLITDDGAVRAGAPEDSFVLMPRLSADALTPAEVQRLPSRTKMESISTWTSGYRCCMTLAIRQWVVALLPS